MDEPNKAPVVPTRLREEARPRLDQTMMPPPMRRPPPPPTGMDKAKAVASGAGWLVVGIYALAAAIAAVISAPFWICMAMLAAFGLYSDSQDTSKRKPR